MIHETSHEPARTKVSASSALTVLACISGLGLAALFIVDLLELGRAYSVAALLAAFIAIAAAVILLSRRSGSEAEMEDRSIHETLGALDDAQRFLGNKISSGDAFRLFCSRIRAVLPYDAVVLFDVDTATSTFVFADCIGEPAGWNAHKGRAAADPIARTALETKRPHQTTMIVRDGTLAASGGDTYFANLAIPLIGKSGVFGVIRFYGRERKAFSNASQELLDAIGERAASLLAGSASFQRSVQVASIDAATDLPNERVFTTVLDHQLALLSREQHRKPLAVVSLDIKGMGSFNESHGYETGDRLMRFVGDQIKRAVREMDFVCRSRGDEFLVMLPTAAEPIAIEVVERLLSTIGGTAFVLDAQRSVKPTLNAGVAHYGQDGERSPELLAVARERRFQSKTGRSESVVWFPRSDARSGRRSD